MATTFDNLIQAIDQITNKLEGATNIGLGSTFEKIEICLILSNSNVSLKEIITFNFTFHISRIKKIITYICSCGIAVFFYFFIYPLGLQKRNITSTKYSLHNLFYLIKCQYNMIQEFPPMDAPKELFIQYITTAYELKSECDKSTVLFENLLTTWELDKIKQL